MRGVERGGASQSRPFSRKDLRIGQLELTMAAYLANGPRLRRNGAGPAGLRVGGG